LFCSSDDATYWEGEAKISRCLEGEECCWGTYCQRSGRLTTPKGKRDQSAFSKTPEGDADAAAGSSGKGEADEIIDLAASPQTKKAWTGRKDAGKGEKPEKDAVAEVDSVYRQSF